MNIYINPETSTTDRFCYSLRSSVQEDTPFEAAYFLLVWERFREGTGHTAVANPTRFAGGQRFALFEHADPTIARLQDSYLTAERILAQVCESTLKEINAL